MRRLRILAGAWVWGLMALVMVGLDDGGWGVRGVVDERWGLRLRGRMGAMGDC